jgi:hypothetical protein
MVFCTSAAGGKQNTAMGWVQEPACRTMCRLLLPVLQALLEARMTEVMQQRCSKRLQAAEPAATGAAAAAASGSPADTAAAAAAAADSEGDGQAAAAAGTSAAAAAAAGGSSRLQPVVVKFSSNEGKAYSKKAFRLAYEQRVGACVGLLSLHQRILQVPCCSSCSTAVSSTRMHKTGLPNRVCCWLCRAAVSTPSSTIDLLQISLAACGTA